jgi:hypothetical protein
MPGQFTGSTTARWGLQGTIWAMTRLLRLKEYQMPVANTPDF